MKLSISLLLLVCSTLTACEDVNSYSPPHHTSNQIEDPISEVGSISVHFPDSEPKDRSAVQKQFIEIVQARDAVSLALLDVKDAESADRQLDALISTLSGDAQIAAVQIASVAMLDVYLTEPDSDADLTIKHLRRLVESGSTESEVMKAAAEKLEEGLAPDLQIAVRNLPKG